MPISPAAAGRVARNHLERLRELTLQPVTVLRMRPTATGGWAAVYRVGLETLERAFEVDTPSLRVRPISPERAYELWSRAS